MAVRVKRDYGDWQASCEAENSCSASSLALFTLWVCFWSAYGTVTSWGALPRLSSPHAFTARFPQEHMSSMKRATAVVDPCTLPGAWSSVWLPVDTQYKALEWHSSLGCFSSKRRMRSGNCHTVEFTSFHVAGILSDTDQGACAPRSEWKEFYPSRCPLRAVALRKLCNSLSLSLQICRILYGTPKSTDRAALREDVPVQ